MLTTGEGDVRLIVRGPEAGARQKVKFDTNSAIDNSIAQAEVSNALARCMCQVGKKMWTTINKTAPIHFMLMRMELVCNPLYCVYSCYIRFCSQGLRTRASTGLDINWR